ncbi:MAG: hypothetical protein WBE92_15095 [Steroidobacteraceae bacterium]
MPWVHRRRLLGTSVGVVLALTLAGLPSSVLAQGSNSADSQAGDVTGPAPCFFRGQWTGNWKATPDARTVYIAVNHRIYRLDLDAAYPLLNSTWTVLSDWDSSNTICNAVDFKLVASDQLGLKEAVIVRRLTPLTHAEAASLPKSLRPS